MLNIIELGAGLFIFGGIGFIVFTRIFDKRWYWFITLIIIGIVWLLFLIYPGILSNERVLMGYLHDVSGTDLFYSSYYLGEISHSIVFLLFAYLFYQLLYVQFVGGFNLNLLPLHVMFVAIGIFAIAADNMVSLLISWSFFDLLLLSYELYRTGKGERIVLRLIGVASTFVVFVAYVGSTAFVDLLQNGFFSILLIALVLSRLVDCYTIDDENTVVFPHFISILIGLSLFWKLESAGLSLGSGFNILLLMLLITLVWFIQHRQGIYGLQFWGLWVFLIIVGGSLGIISNPVLWGAIGLFGFDCVELISNIIESKGQKIRGVGTLIILTVLIFYLNRFNLETLSQIGVFSWWIYFIVWIMLLVLVSWGRLFYARNGMSETPSTGGTGFYIALCTIVILSVLSIIIRFLPTLEVDKLGYFGFVVMVYIAISLVLEKYVGIFNRSARFLRSIISFRWFVSVIDWIYEICRLVYETIRVVLESETGMFWTIVLLIAITTYWLVAR